jgi:hypothetical protein
MSTNETRCLEKYKSGQLKIGANDALYFTRLGKKIYCSQYLTKKQQDQYLTKMSKKIKRVKRKSPKSSPKKENKIEEKKEMQEEKKEMEEEKKEMEQPEQIELTQEVVVVVPNDIPQSDMLTMSEPVLNPAMVMN